mmetsp:Transcript_14301/g.31348  ORF Transcript_14301/g.31348 Transcript_14301/m.31348 type:complete len:513 (-) Transcript_14301:2027-3565(-)
MMIPKLFNRSRRSSMPEEGQPRPDGKIDLRDKLRKTASDLGPSIRPVRRPSIPTTIDFVGATAAAARRESGLSTTDVEAARRESGLTEADAEAAHTVAAQRRDSDISDITLLTFTDEIVETAKQEFLRILHMPENRNLPDEDLDRLLQDIQSNLTQSFKVKAREAFARKMAKLLSEESSSSISNDRSLTTESSATTSSRSDEGGGNLIVVHRTSLCDTAPRPQKRASDLDRSCSSLGADTVKQGNLSDRQFGGGPIPEGDDYGTEGTTASQPPLDDIPNREDGSARSDAANLGPPPGEFVRANRAGRRPSVQSCHSRASYHDKLDQLILLKLVTAEQQAEIDELNRDLQQAREELAASTQARRIEELEADNRALAEKVGEYQFNANELERDESLRASLNSILIDGPGNLPATPSSEDDERLRQKNAELARENEELRGRIVELEGTLAASIGRERELRLSAQSDVSSLDFRGGGGRRRSICNLHKSSSGRSSMDSTMDLTDYNSSFGSVVEEK